MLSETIHAWTDKAKNNVYFAGSCLISLILLCVIYGVKCFLAFHVPIVKTNSAVLTPATQVAVDISQLSAQHLFGHSAETAVLPITSLQIKLMGVLIDKDPTLSRAIITAQSGKGKLYKIGDEVIGGIAIDAILADHVVLKRNDELENLPLLRAALQFKPSQDDAAIE